MTHEERRQRRAAIAKAVEASGDVCGVARSYGITRSTVEIACREHGVTYNPLPRPGRTKRILGILAALQESSETQEEIASRFGVTKQWVGQLLAKARQEGLKFPGRDRVKPIPDEMPPSQRGTP